MKVTETQMDPQQTTHGENPHIGIAPLKTHGKKHHIGKTTQDHTTTGTDLTMNLEREEAHHSTDLMKGILYKRRIMDQEKGGVHLMNHIDHMKGDLFPPITTTPHLGMNMKYEF